MTYVLPRAHKHPPEMLSTCWIRLTGHNRPSIRQGVRIQGPDYCTKKATISLLEMLTFLVASSALSTDRVDTSLTEPRHTWSARLHSASHGAEVQEENVHEACARYDCHNSCDDGCDLLFGSSGCDDGCDGGCLCAQFHPHPSPPPPGCGMSGTDDDAICYLDRYSDLKNAFCPSVPSCSASQINQARCARRPSKR